MEIDNNMFKTYWTSGIIVLLIGVSIIPSTASGNFYPGGNTLYAGGSGPGNYTTIQAAIDDAKNGDTVFVYDDSSPYYENVVVDKSINLIGENRDTVIVDGGGSGNVIYISGDRVNLSGFTLQNSGSGESDAGIHIWSNDSTIYGNVIDNNFYGIYQFHSTRNNIVENDVTNNNNCGIVLIGSTLTTVSYNYVYGQPFNGIGLSQGSEKNTIFGRMGKLLVLIPWINFDWHPAQEPYNIP